MYLVTKTYGHELGLSACFRQWRAESHCRFLHGYPLSFKLTFSAGVLDKNNWVLDFGGLKQVKAWLVENFDHRLVVATDDPQRERLEALGQPITDGYGCNKIECPQLADVLVIPFVGCEGFAAYVAKYVETWLRENYAECIERRGLRLCEIEVREHAGNSAILRR